MIICKWLTDFTGQEYTAPSIISTMINMCLNGGRIEYPTVGVVGSTDFQQGLSVFLLIVALITVPWMLAIKPVLLNKHNEELRKLH